MPILLPGNSNYGTLAVSKFIEIYLTKNFPNFMQLVQPLAIRHPTITVGSWVVKWAVIGTRFVGKNRELRMDGSGFCWSGSVL